MKKSIILTSLIVFLFAGTSFAEDPDLFSYDKGAVDVEMATLNELEQYVLRNPGVSLSALKEAGIPLANSISELHTYSPMNQMHNGPFEIDGFLWGCCLGPAGVLVVYIITEDMNETRGALIGCIVGTALIGGAIILHEIFISGHYYWY